MTLGRPSITTGQSDIPLPMAANDDPLPSVPSQNNAPCTSFFVQAINLNKILADILTDIYKPWSHLGGRNQIGQLLKNNSFDIIINLDNKLSDFKCQVPEQLYWGRRDRERQLTEISLRQSNVLHARLVAMYLVRVLLTLIVVVNTWRRFVHLKLLLYRPIFNKLCVESKLGSARTSSDFDRRDATNNMLYCHFAQHCAEACVGAAEELINIIDTASQTLATGAWWYNVFCKIMVYRASRVLIACHRSIFVGDGPYTSRTLPYRSRTWSVGGRSTVMGSVSESPRKDEFA